MDVIYSTILGNSADAFQQIAGLHVPAGSVILDMTWGAGIFWRNVNPQAYEVWRIDRAPRPGIDVRADCTSLPFRPGTFDAAVLDPPYGNMSTRPRRDSVCDLYNLSSCMSPDEVRRFYTDLLWQAYEALKLGGILIVKCQNFVNGGKNHWMEIEIYNEARFLRFIPVDKFHVVPPTKPNLRHPNRPQQHARKWGSTFWVFRKR